MIPQLNASNTVAQNDRFVYRAYGSLLQSDIPLPELPKAQNGVISWQFRAEAGGVRWRNSRKWFHTWRSPGGTAVMRAAKISGGYLVRFPRLAEFNILRSGRIIEGRPLNGSEPGVLRHLLLDHIIPYCLSLQGKVVLHAGAVMIRGRAVLFLGETGAGKSTLCASFNRAGYPLLSDDGLLIQFDGKRFCCVPSYPGIRIWPDSLRQLYGSARAGQFMPGYPGKRRILDVRKVSNGVKRLTPIAGIFILVPGKSDRRNESPPEISVETPSPHEVLLSLLRQTFRLDLTSARLIRREFRVLSRLASKKFFRKLHYPQSYRSLEKLRHSVLSSL